MDSFDFHRLTDFDFEELCKDLFEDELGLKFEIFSRGRDHGIDLRHSCSDHGLVIVQCKHWIRSDGTRLVRHFRTEEKPKIERLKPDRYLIATTTELSVDNKDSMVKDLQPWIRSPGDIHGAHDLAALLRENPELVKRHLRLWLSSSVVLDALMNKSIFVRSRDLAEDAAEAIQTYAPNTGFVRAQALLEQGHICIIAGEPGIGKTTLAQVLAQGYNGQLLLEVLEQLRVPFLAAVRDTIDAEPINLSYESEFCNRTNTLLALCEHFEDRRLIDFTADRLARAEIPQFGEGSDDMISLVNSVRLTSVAEISQHYERLAEMTAKWIYDGVIAPDFGDLRSIQSQLDELPTTGSYSAGVSPR